MNPIKFSIPIEQLYLTRLLHFFIPYISNDNPLEVKFLQTKPFQKWQLIY